VIPFETSALCSLHSIAGAEEQFRAARVVDLDGDGRGEYGTIAELSAAVALPDQPNALRPPVLSGAFRTVRPDGTVLRSGYRFRVLLPDADGDGVGESGAPQPTARPATQPGRS
jgi:hypothetical protein